jgi:hypothetical protein
MALRRLAVLVMAVSVLACACYEWVPDFLSPECANFVRPTHRLVREVPSSDTARLGVVRGRVLPNESATSVAEAHVELRGDTIRRFTTDSTGRFVFDGVNVGRHRLLVRRIGYDISVDSITVPLTPGRELEVRLQLSVLDGPCSGFGAVRVRKPWWKLW